MTKMGRVGGARTARRALTSAVVAWLTLGLMAAACGGATGTDLGGESHFLGACTSSCTDNLTCVGGLCTKDCSHDAAVCDALAPGATCRPDSSTSVCDVPCVDVRECAGALDGSYRCDAGFCRHHAVSSAGGASSGATSSGGASFGGTSAGGTSNGGAPAGGSAGGSGAGGGGTTNPASCQYLFESYPSGSLVPRSRDCGHCRCDDGALVDCVSEPCAAGIPVRECPENVPFTDNHYTRDARIVGTTLAADVLVSGGCPIDYDFALCYEPTFLESYPVQVPMHWIVDKHMNTCAALGTSSLTFDLTPLTEMYQQAYQTPSGIIDTLYGVFGFGELSCEEAQATAASQAELIGSARRLCETDEDCIRFQLDTSCSASCGTIIRRSTEVVAQERMAEVEAALCPTAPTDCKVELPCPPPAPLECFESTCRQIP